MEGVEQSNFQGQEKVANGVLDPDLCPSQRNVGTQEVGLAGASSRSRGNHDPEKLGNFLHP